MREGVFLTPELCETPHFLTQGVNYPDTLAFGGQKGVKFCQKSVETLLASLADLRMALNDSLSVKDVSADTGLLATSRGTP